MAPHNASEINLVFCFRAYHYEVTALTDMEIVRAHFITAGAACDMIPFNSIVGKIKKINYKFTQVAFNEPLELLLNSVRFYLQNDMKPVLIAAFELYFFGISVALPKRKESSPLRSLRT